MYVPWGRETEEERLHRVFCSFTCNSDESIPILKTRFSLPSGNTGYMYNPSYMALCNKKTCFALLFMSTSQDHLAPYSLPYIKAAIYCTSCRWLKCTLHSCLYWSLAISNIAHHFWGEAWWGGKTPWNRSAERPISRSTICPSNDYLVALWCDTVGWRGSIANILSLSLWISTQLCTTDDTWSGLCLVQQHRNVLHHIH